MAPGSTLSVAAIVGLEADMDRLLRMMEEANAGMCSTLKTLASSAPSSSSTSPASSTPAAVPTAAAPPSTTARTAAPTTITTTLPGVINKCSVVFSACSEHAAASHLRLGVARLSSSTPPAYMVPTTSVTEPTAAPTSWPTPTDLIAASTPTPTPSATCAQYDLAVAPPTKCSTDCFGGDTNMLVPGSRLATIRTLLPASTTSILTIGNLDYVPMSTFIHTKEVAALEIGLFLYAHQRFEVLSSSPCAFSVNDGKCYGSVMLWPPPLNHRVSSITSCVFDSGKSRRGKWTVTTNVQEAPKVFAGITNMSPDSRDVSTITCYPG